jgi:hypothetical protein
MRKACAADAVKLESEVDASLKVQGLPVATKMSIYALFFRTAALFACGSITD